ncbi:MAG: restriction endonuclease subunit S, partial [Rhodoglobus sp.]
MPRRFGTSSGMSFASRSKVLRNERAGRTLDVEATVTPSARTAVSENRQGQLDAKKLIENFDVVAEAAGGIGRLRELAIELAVRGLLLDDADPSSWKPVLLSDVVVDVRNGIAKRGGDSGSAIPVLRLADIDGGSRLRREGFREIVLTSAEARQYRLETGDILVIRVNGSANLVGKFVPFDAVGEWAYSDHLIRVRPNPSIVDTGFLCALARSAASRAHVVSKTVTTAGQHTINQVGLGSLPLLLPPLTTAEGPSEFDAAWKRVVNNLEVIIGRTDCIAELRRTILQLAIRGRLVGASEGDEEAPVLLDRLRSHRSDLVAAKRIRGAAAEVVSSDDELFEIPAGWVWARLGDLGDWGAGSTPSRSRPDYYGGSVPWFKSGELNDAYLERAEETVSDKALAECSLRLNAPGDVLVAMYGATIGKAAILQIQATTNQAVCACTCFPGVDNRYLLVLLRAYKSAFVGQGAGGAQPNISKEKIVATPVPLPPTTLQARIVAKVEQFMEVCDNLEAALRRAEDRAAKFA